MSCVELHFISFFFSCRCHHHHYRLKKNKNRKKIVNSEILYDDDRTHKIISLEFLTPLFCFFFWVDFLFWLPHTHTLELSEKGRKEQKIKFFFIEKPA